MLFRSLITVFEPFLRIVWSTETVSCSNRAYKLLITIFISKAPSSGGKRIFLIYSTVSLKLMKVFGIVI